MAQRTIGELVFGLGANTRGLQRAEKELRGFRQSVNKTAQSQQRGARAQAKALNRQSKLIGQNLRQVSKLNKQLRKVGAPNEAIARNTKAFKDYQRRLQSGVLSTQQLNKEQDRLNQRLGRVQSRVRNTSRSTSTWTERVDSLARAVRGLEGPLGGTAARLQTLTAALKSGQAAAVAFSAAIAGTVAGIGLFTAAAVRVQLQLERVRSGLRVASDSARETEASFQFLRQTSRELGLDFQAAADQFANFKISAQAAGISARETQQIFTGVAEASRALGLSAADTTGVMRAFSQIASKGTVQSEELRGQIGERLPGAFSLAAESIGVTTAELNTMLKEGEVAAEDLLPKLGQKLSETFGPQAQRNADNLRGAINNFRNEVTFLIANMDDLVGASERFNEILNLINDGIESINADLENNKFGTVVRDANNATSAVQKVNQVLEILEKTSPSGINFGPKLAQRVLELSGALEKVRLPPQMPAEMMALRNETDKTTKSVTDLLEVFNNLDEDPRRGLQALLTQMDQARAKLEAFQMGGEAALQMKESLFTARDAAKEFKSELQELVEEQEGFTAQDKRRAIERYRVRLKALGFTGNNLEEQLQKVVNQTRNYENRLDQQRNSIQENNEALQELAKRYTDAAQSTEDVKADALTQIRDIVSGFGGEIQETRQRIAELQSLITAAKRWDPSAVETLNKVLEEQKDTLEELQNTGKEQIKRNNQLADAYLTSADAVERLNDQFDRTDKIEKFREELEDAGLAQSKINKRVNEFRKSLQRLDAAKKIREISSAIETRLSDAFEGVLKNSKEGFDDFFETIKNDFISWLADLAARAATNAIVVPIVTSVVGGTGGGIVTQGVQAAAGLSGVGSTAGGGGGGLLSGISSLSNLSSAGSLLSNLGQGLGSSVLASPAQLASAAPGIFGGTASSGGQAFANTLAGTAAPNALASGVSLATSPAAIGGGFVGNFAANQLIEGGNPIARSVGGALGGIGGGLVGGTIAAGGSLTGAAAGAAAGSVVPIVGTAIGAALGAFGGNALGSLVPADKDFPFGAGTLGRNLNATKTAELDGFNATKLKEGLEQQGQGLRRLAQAVGAESANLQAPVRLGFSSGRGQLQEGFFVGGGGTKTLGSLVDPLPSRRQGLSREEAKELFNNVVFENLRFEGDVNSFLADITRRSGKLREGDIGEITKDINLTKTLIQATDGLSQYERKLKDVRKEYKKQIERAEELGLSSQELRKQLQFQEREIQLSSRQATQNLRGQLLGVLGGSVSRERRLDLGIDQINLKYDRLRQTAKDLGVSLDLVEKARAEEIEQLKEQLEVQTAMNLALSKAKDRIKDFLEGLRSGTQSPFSPQKQLTAAREQFQETLKKARGGDDEAAQKLPQVASKLLKQAEQVFGRGPEFFERFRLVVQALENAIGEDVVPGYARGTKSASRGLAVVGEDGPELVNFRGGESVSSNNDIGSSLMSIRDAITGEGGNVDAIVETSETTHDLLIRLIEEVRNMNRNNASRATTGAQAPTRRV